VRGILIAGSGGQGVLFLGKLLAEGAMLGGKCVTWFPSYGAEMRGGTANCTVVISEEIIGSPIIRNPDVLVVMNEASKERFEARIKPDGFLIMDSSLIRTPPRRTDVHVLMVPASEIAASLGSPKSANMVMLGAMLSLGGVIDEEYAVKALEELTPARRRASLEPNKNAIRKGKAYFEDKKGKGL
jgi:2-oxoglutarate ferredoxin oxidoreductase subunit gamma